MALISEFLTSINLFTQPAPCGAVYGAKLQAASAQQFGAVHFGSKLAGADIHQRKYVANWTKGVFRIL